MVEEKVILDNFGDYLGKARRGKDGYDFAMLLTGYVNDNVYEL